MHHGLGAVQKTTPAGGGDPAGVADIDWQPWEEEGGPPILSGTLGGGERRPTDETYIDRARLGRKREMGMAPMRLMHGLCDASTGVPRFWAERLIFSG